FGLHREGRRHREGRDRSGSDILDLLRRAVHAAASLRIRQSFARADRRARGRLLASQHRLDWRQVRHRPAHAHQGDAHPALRRAAVVGSLKTASFRPDPYFGFWVPTSVAGVEPHLLYPFKTWRDKSDFDQTARKLVRMFRDNFVRFEGQVDADVKAAAPEVRI